MLPGFDIESGLHSFSRNARNGLAIASVESAVVFLLLLQFQRNILRILISFAEMSLVVKKVATQHRQRHVLC